MKQDHINFQLLHLKAEGSNWCRLLDLAGKILTLDRIPTKFLTVADNYFKNLEYRSELYAMAYRQTLQKIDDGVY